jgi:hypothetical protein
VSAAVLSIAAAALVAACLCSTSVGAQTSDSIVGEYDCDKCHGVLTLKRVSSADLQVWLRVGSGSCSGEALVNPKVRNAGGVLEVPHKQGQLQCFARIEFAGKGASVTDTCITARDEQNSPCAMLGTYSKRKR